MTAHARPDASGERARRDPGRRVVLLAAAAVLAVVGLLLVGWSAAHQVTVPSAALAGDPPELTVPVPADPTPTPAAAGSPPVRLHVETRPLAAPGFRPGPLFGEGPGSLSVSLVAVAAAPAAVTPVPPSTLTMPASAPAALRVPAIGVDAAVGSVGLNPDRSMEVPAPGPTWDLPAWYRYSVTPGERGPSVIVGHVDSHVTGPSVFFDLARLRADDVVEVARTDGSVARFAVTRVERFAKSAFPTDAVYAGTAGPELRLITCGGSFDRAVRSYRDNTVVFARLI